MPCRWPRGSFIGEHFSLLPEKRGYGGDDVRSGGCVVVVGGGKNIIFVFCSVKQQRLWLWRRRRRYLWSHFWGAWLLNEEGCYNGCCIQPTYYTIVAWKESAPATFRDRKEGEEAATSNPTKRRKLGGLKKSPQRKNCKQEDCLHLLGLLSLSKSATAVKRNIPESYVFVVVESMICQLRSIVRHRGRLLKIPRYGSLVPPPLAAPPPFPTPTRRRRRRRRRRLSHPFGFGCQKMPRIGCEHDGATERNEGEGRAGQTVG